MVADFARGRGHSYWAFLLIGLLFSWVLSLIVVLLMSDRSGPQEVVLAGGQGDHLDQLQKLTELRDSGTLSADEFEAEKARILQRRD
jgi:hypothetical protein